MADATRARTTGPRRRPGGRADPDRLAELEEERDFLLASLRDLEAEHEAGDLDDADHAALKDDYTARAADVLRAIEADQALRAAAPRRSPTRVAMWVVGVLAVGVLAGLLVAQASGQRGSGDTISGDIRQSSRDLLLAAEDQWASGDVEGALATYDEVLALQPTNAEALAYKAWVGRTGEVLDDEAALALLDEAVAADGGYADARVFRAIVLRDLDRTEEAAADLLALPIEDVPPGMAAMVGGFGVGLAEARMFAGDVVAANEVLDVVLALDPENADALLGRGVLLGRAAAEATGEDQALLVARSLEALDEAEAIAGDQAAIWLARAQTLAGAGRDAEAVAALDVAADLPQSEDLAAQVEALRGALAG